MKYRVAKLRDAIPGLHTRKTVQWQMALFHTAFVHWRRQIPSIWFQKFCASRGIQRVVFGNVFGDRNELTSKFSSNWTHAFVTFENTREPHWSAYHDHLLDAWDVGLGFESIDHPNYLRFPYWLFHLVSPVAANPGQAFVDRIHKSHNPDRPHFASIVASHDSHFAGGAGMRAQAKSALSPLGEVLSAGKWQQNTDLLQTRYGDRKERFLEDCRFNLAIENSSNSGYVTEKIFQSLMAGAVPIYWGNEGKPPEPEVLRQDAFVWFDPVNPQRTVEAVQALEDHPRDLLAFRAQPKLTDHAAEWINEKFESLAEHLRRGPVLG